MRRLTAAAASTSRIYRIDQPVATHMRPATCDEVECSAQQLGWTTTVDEATDLGQRQAGYIRRESGRAFLEERAGALTVFVFEPGQRCFAQHHVPLDRPAFFSVRGDVTRRHARAEDWRDDMGEHLDHVRDRIARG